ncbi:MAG TPA: hypothetical protein VFT43_06130 [Candidatus Polarisedimenticolia bacterium]|nr:hypothetical protein [Candidatus Polarisedimenticolia bacterium]
MRAVDARGWDLRLRRAGRAALAALAALTALRGLPAAPARAEAPSTPPFGNEDVVRMVMARVPMAEIIARIESGPVAFDLTPEVVEELRLAGVGEPILAAMRRRQSMTAPAAPPTTTPAVAPATGTLEVLFPAPPKKDRPWEHSALALRSLPEGAERRSTSSAHPGPVAMSDMALAILCLTVDHVPDHWDASTPLKEGPRHELLLFRKGVAEHDMRGLRMIYLKHDDDYRLALPEGVHDIMVAPAGQRASSGDWVLFPTPSVRVTILPGRTTRLTMRAESRISGSRLSGLAVDVEWKVASVEGPEPGP